MKKLLALTALIVSVSAFAAGDPVGFNGPVDNGSSIAIPVPKNYSDAIGSKIKRECSYKAAVSGIKQLVKGLSEEDIKAYHDPKTGLSAAYTRFDNGTKLWFYPDAKIVIQGENAMVRNEYYAHMYRLNNSIRTAQYSFPKIEEEYHKELTVNGYEWVYDKISVSRGGLATFCDSLNNGCVISPIYGIQFINLVNFDPREVDEFGRHTKPLETKSFEIMIDFDEWTNCLVDELSKL